MANYVNPEELKQEILLSKERDELTPKAVEMLMLMAKEASKKLRYKDEEDRKDNTMHIEDIDGFVAALKFITGKSI